MARASVLSRQAGRSRRGLHLPRPAQGRKSPSPPPLSNEAADSKALYILLPEDFQGRREGFAVLTFPVALTDAPTFNRADDYDYPSEHDLEAAATTMVREFPSSFRSAPQRSGECENVLGFKPNWSSSPRVLVGGLYWSSRGRTPSLASCPEADLGVATPEADAGKVGRGWEADA